MNSTSTLTLSQAVLSLQQACSHLGRLESIAASLSTTVTTAGDLDAYGLSGAAVRSLTHLRNGRVIGEEQSLRALALLAARVGAAENAAAAEEAATSPLLEVRSSEAIRGLLSTKEFSTKPPKDGFWARMADPTDGFLPFLTAGGTKVAFFPTPGDLGRPWTDVIAGHWENGVGLVAFQNEKTGACGMIFLHGIGRAPWSRPDRNLWYSSGGSMAFPQERLSFADALTRVVDKGVAMTHKWRSVDEALHRVRHKTLTGLGGSKGILLHGKNGQGFAKGLEVYGEVLTVLGITLTGSDEGIGPASADALAKLAPGNIVGSSNAHYRGYGPIPHTKEGVQHAIAAVHKKLFGGKEMPVLLLGYGGIGSLLHGPLSKDRLTPLSGIVDIDPPCLVSLRENYPGLNLFQDRSVRVPTTTEGLSLRWNKIPSVAGLARIVEMAKGTSLLSPNGGPHPIDFNVAAALIESGVRAVAGSANNQAGTDASGSPDPIAWILQAGGVCMAADFVVNRSGAAAVIANGIVLGFAQLQQTEKLVGDNVEEEIEFAFRRGVPPFIHERLRAERAWNQRIAAGEAKGGKFRSAE